MSNIELKQSLEREYGDYSISLPISNIELKQMEDYIDKHHVYSFRRFAQYCRANQPTWHRHLTTDCGWYVKEYIKSAYWDDLTPEGRAVAKLADQDVHD